MHKDQKTRQSRGSTAVKAADDHSDGRLRAHAGEGGTVEGGAATGLQCPAGTEGERGEEPNLLEIVRGSLAIQFWKKEPHDGKEIVFVRDFFLPELHPPLLSLGQVGMVGPNHTSQGFPSGFGFSGFEDFDQFTERHRRPAQ